MHGQLWSGLAQQRSGLFNRYSEPTTRNSYSGTLCDYEYVDRCGGARPLTFTKLTPRSNAAKYRTSGTDTDKTCEEAFLQQSSTSSTPTYLVPLL